MKVKNLLLSVSGLISLLIIAIGIWGTYKLCLNNEICVNVLHFLFLHLLPTLPLFIFSLITYFMPESVFRAWSRFAIVWIPLSMLGIFLAPEYSGGWMPLYPIEKGTVAFALSVLFVVISLIIIAIAAFKNKSSGKAK